MGNVLSLFSGAGGAVEGFKQSGHNIVAAVDRNDDAVATLKTNHSDVQVIEEDLSVCSPTDFTDRYDIQPSDVDIVVGGPPCQGFSLSGKRDPDDERNELVTDFLDYVSHFQPNSFVMENVTGILSMEDGAAVDYVYERGGSLGYDVSHETLSAADFAVPQDRDRVFFVGTRETYNWPSPERRVTVGETFTFVDECHPNHTAPRHQQKTIDRIAGTDQGERLYESFKQNQRLDASGLAPTVIAGGGGWKYAHPMEDRALTIHERALLQGFPVEYVFEGGVGEMRRQTGNATPPPLAAAVASGL